MGYDTEICRAKVVRILSEVEFFTCDVGAGQLMCPVVAKLATVELLLELVSNNDPLKERSLSIGKS